MKKEGTAVDTETADKIDDHEADEEWFLVDSSISD